MPSPNDSHRSIQEQAVRLPLVERLRLSQLVDGMVGSPVIPMGDLPEPLGRLEIPPARRNTYVAFEPGPELRGQYMSRTAYAQGLAAERMDIAEERARYFRGGPPLGSPAHDYPEHPEHDATSNMKDPELTTYEFTKRHLSQELY